MVDFITQKEFNSKLIREVGVVLAVGVVLGVVILFVRYDIARRAALVQEYKKELKTVNEASLALSSLKVDFERAKPYFSLFDNILPARDNLISFPKDIAFLAKKNKVAAAVSFGAETGATPKTPGYVSFNMTMQGAYSDILLFVQALEQGKYIIDLSEITFSLEDKKYSATAFGKVFFHD